MPTTWIWGPPSSLLVQGLHSTNSLRDSQHEGCKCCPSFLQLGGKLNVPCTNNGTHMGLRCLLHESHLPGFAIVDQNKIDENQLIVMCTHHDQGNMIKSHALIDYSATGYTWIDKDYAYHHHLPYTSSSHLETLPSLMEDLLPQG
jgi:hypothetical protein